MGGILGPEARPPPPKNFHRENIQNMHNKEQEMQHKRNEESKMTPENQQPWKMKRFASVESKLG